MLSAQRCCAITPRPSMTWRPTRPGGPMRAATYIGDQTFRVEDREPSEPAPGEVRLDVGYVGICGTDLHIKHGAMDARVTIPAVIGHEMSGRVAAVGEG